MGAQGVQELAAAALPGAGLPRRTRITVPAGAQRAGGGRTRLRSEIPPLPAAGRSRRGGGRGNPVQVGEQLVVETRAAWQGWLDEHHATAAEIWLVSYRRSARARSLANAAACEEALCYGWAAGPTAMLDGDSYATRFAPRRKGATWSDLDIARARRLARAGRLRAAGIAVLPRHVRSEIWPRLIEDR
jgi:hypothetical protein